MTKTDKPFAPACERNQEVLLKTLKAQLRADDKHLLEVGSGTGQHAVYMGKHMPDITWQTSDVKENHAGIKMWLGEAGLDNVSRPVAYQIGKDQWPNVDFDVVFCANVLHIIAEALVEQLINDLGKKLRRGHRVIFYGPFKYQGEFTSASNADFEIWLRDIDSKRGIRDFEVIQNLMNQQNFKLIKDIPMPANNQFLIFEKQTL